MFSSRFHETSRSINTFIIFTTFALLLSSSKAQDFASDDYFARNLVNARRTSGNNAYGKPETGTQSYYPQIILAIIYPTAQPQQGVSERPIGLRKAFAPTSRLQKLPFRTDDVPFNELPNRRLNPRFQELNTGSYLSKNGPWAVAEQGSIPTPPTATTSAPTRRRCPSGETYDQRRMKCLRFTSPIKSST